mgnify:FL=1
MSALSYWIWLSNAELSVRTKAALMEHYGDAETAFFAPAGEFAHIEGVSRADAAILERRDMSDTARIIEECQAQGLSVISYQDSAYPSRLRNIYAPPPVLYIKGRLPAVDDNAVIAVVGTRKATPYGLKMARTIAGEIVRCGGIVISGLTYGIDAEAAEGALNAGGICVGVLGTAHQDDAGVLYAGVAERGAVISEYAPGSPAQRSFFRDRNRITAGLSVGAVAVEAPEKSGTRLFVAEAAAQGKEIFAVPGNADAKMSAGTIDMLKDGAKPVTCGWDVVSEFEYLFPGKLRKAPASRGEMRRIEAESVGNAPVLQKETKKVIDKENGRRYIDLKDQLRDLSETQLKIITAVDNGGTHIDDIIETTGLGTATVLAQLTVLEIKGYIRREAGRRIALNTAKK